MRDSAVDLGPRLRALAPHESERRSAPRASRRLLRAVLLAQLAWLAARAVGAQDVSPEEMRGLDEQVQEVKSDVLGIAAELGRLEEKLLYPSSTQVAVFLSLNAGEEFRLDSVQIQIDGAPVARHVYRFEELTALRKGGVQRLYTGNVAAGEHRLEVSMAGKLASGQDVAATERFAFSKDVEPKLVEITLAGAGSGAPSIRLGGQ